MWQNAPDSSRSPWVQELKDLMKKNEQQQADPKSVDPDAETDSLGPAPESPSSSSCGIPDNLLGVVDEPDLASVDEVGL